MNHAKANAMKHFRILLLIAFLSTTGRLGAQAPPPPPGSSNPAPIGGLILLAAAGAAYGGKKAYDQRREH